MQGIGQLVHDAPLWVVSPLLLVAMVVAWSVGEAGRRRLSRSRAASESASGDEGYIMSAVFGLLALLIAFTFNLSLGRYEARRELVVTEANALGTTYLRTGLVDDPARLRALLRDYTRLRLDFGLAGGDVARRLDRQSDVAQQAIWAEAMARLQPQRGNSSVPTLLQPLNEAIDTAAERRATMAARIPIRILATLSLYAVAAAAVLGYAVARSGKQHRAASIVLFVLLTVAIGTIVDLDQPRAGLIRISQQPMVEALAAMQP